MEVKVEGKELKGDNGMVSKGRS